MHGRDQGYCDFKRRPQHGRRTIGERSDQFYKLHHGGRSAPYFVRLQAPKPHILGGLTKLYYTIGTYGSSYPALRTYFYESSGHS
jgi:hypothetical protein